MSVRVVAGAFKRRILKTPAGLHTRPTAARVREALFSILGNLEGARVLDLYAGSGALGIEALSRGAAHAAFVESEHKAQACIRDNLRMLELEERGVLLALPVERAFKELSKRGIEFDLVFCDPPWSEIERAATLLATLPPLLASAARLVVEHPAGRAPNIEGFERADERRWGDTGVSLFVAP